MLKFTIKRGDTSPALTLSLSPSSVSLAGARVQFRMRAVHGPTVIDRPAQILQAFQPVILRYLWDQEDLLQPGKYEAEFEVTYLDGSIETFPNLGYIEVFVSQEIAGKAPPETP